MDLSKLLFMWYFQFSIVVLDLQQPSHCSSFRTPTAASITMAPCTRVTLASMLDKELSLHINFELGHS